MGKTEVPIESNFYGLSVKGFIEFFNLQQVGETLGNPKAAILRLEH